MPKHFEAAIFDLDGTLLNTLEDLANASNRVLARRGYPLHDLDAYRHFVGEGVTMLMTRAVPPQFQSNRTIIEECVRAFREDYGQNWKVKTKPYDGMIETLSELAKRGLRLAVLSNKPDDSTQECVTEFFPTARFDFVLGQREGIPPKPNPLGALAIAERLDVAPERILYVGDTSIDMKTAIAAGMFAVGVLWGFRYRA
ncbi:MAG: HAD family hydrolase, partial [Chloroflexi bacterium]|nr:HAD family hydrolase [Chloroflexota bacterium]